MMGRCSRGKIFLSFQKISLRFTVIPKPVDAISKEDMENLVAARVSERRTLDYKQQLPGGRDDDKREFLYDVASFANASGGDLIFGITDERDASGKSTGLPDSADGVHLSNASDMITRLENLIRDGIEPRIQGMQWKQIDGFPKGTVVVMRVPKSLVSPHMVVFGGVRRFYSRNSTGKFPMDVGEIRAAFMETSSIGERLRTVRAQRLEYVMTGRSPLGLHETPIVVVHVLPVSSPSDPSRDVTKAAARLQLQLAPIRAHSWGGRYNFDGYLVTEPKSSMSYVQVFRSGAIEAGDAGLLCGMPEQYKNQLPSIALEQELLGLLQRFLDASKQLSTSLPLFIAMSLLRVRGFKMSGDPFNPFPGNEGIDRDVLELPEVFVEDYGSDLGKVLRPSFDALWQACGGEQSANYDSAGNWRPFRQ
jgi:hypothetical protein